MLLGIQNYDRPHAVRLWCAFTTASMAVGYACTRNHKPKVRPCVYVHCETSLDGIQATIFRHPNPHQVRADGRPKTFITSVSL